MNKSFFLLFSLLLAGAREIISFSFFKQSTSDIWDALKKNDTDFCRRYTG